MQKASWTVALLMAALLAGCADEPAPAEDEGALRVAEVKATKQAGAIGGVVVDDTIRPVVGATVTLRGATIANLTTQTDAVGQFAYEDLEPGTYFLDVQAEGHFRAQSSVTVAAGQVASAKVLLEVDRTPQPYHETFDFNGILVVSDWYGTYLLTTALGNTALCECEFHFEPGPVVTDIIVEAVWESRLGIPDHQLYFELETVEPSEGVAEYSTSPALLRHPRGAFDADAEEFLVRVSSDVGADVDQPFELFVTLFHNGPAPRGWSFVEQSS
ncbi:MAG: carboxypeptidase-like regulatory domain-containing protein [Thermoplasmatota archaeon]